MLSCMRTDIAERESEIRQWIKDKQPKALMCRELRCKPETLESWLTKLGISYAGNQGNRGRPSGAALSAEAYAQTRFPKTDVLRRKLIRDGIRPHSCEVCGVSEWQGRPAPLELHHLDGNRNNNLLVNLQIICPNCHAQTDTHAGKGIGRFNVV